MDGAYSTHGTDEKCIQYFHGEPEVMRPLERPTRRWEDSIGMNLKKMSWEDTDLDAPGSG
jgi:hypothetical protein